jgi:uncharacterized protein YcbK (DUF882 family)
MLKAAGALVGTSALVAAGGVRSAPSCADESARRIALRNLNTGERLELDYFRDGAYLSEALSAIEVLLRDLRNDAQHAVDPKLLDYLVDAAAMSGVQPVFGVISGFRSPPPHPRSRSLHMQGRAIDVCITGADCAVLAAGAAQLQRGGIGYYRASNFVHLDTGAFRTWRG